MGIFLLTGIVIHFFEPFKMEPRRLLTSNVGGRSAGFGMAPDPKNHKEALIQVYAARTRGSKGVLAVHTWIATKRKDADQYVISQIVGWAMNEQGTSLFQLPGIPDKRWYGNEPELILDYREADAEALIEKIDLAIKKYPWASNYAIWPGPNSNTYVAWIGLQVPELGLDLPSTAIGKDWRPLKHTLWKSPSGTGIQLSYLGLLGATIGVEEGLELNVLGLSFELDLLDLAIELPSIGRVGRNQVNLVEQANLVSQKLDR